MADIKRRCVGCMREIDDVLVCPYCGYSENTPISKEFLPPRTMLQNRYLVGRPLRYNGEGVSYIAYDTVINGVVEIREYFPDKLSSRASDGTNNIEITQGYEAQFKALLVDFAELSDTLMKMRTLTNLQQTYEIFRENATIYAVREHVAGITFSQYLSENSGEINWEEAYRLLRPVMESVSAIHSYQILHRGISPDTLRVTKRGELKLCDFSVMSARNVRTEISPEIFVGYAAPEQFSSAIQQGTWTDVYAICAVFYRALTGSRPPEVNTRGYTGNVIPPSVLNHSVKSAVSDVILRGLSESPENRIKTVNVLLSEFSQALAPPPVEVVDEVPEEEENKPDQKKKRYGLMALLITAGVLAVVGFFVVYFAISGIDRGSDSSSDDSSMSSDESDASSDESSEESESSEPSSESEPSSSISGVTYVMPNLVGQYFEAAKGNETYQKMFKLEAVYEYNDSVEKGNIFEQDLKANSLISEGSLVKVKVSKGTQHPEIPNFSGYKKDSYLALLDDLGIAYELSTEGTSEVSPGHVLSVTPPVGTRVDLEENVKVQVVIAEKPAPEEESDSNE